MPSAPGTIRLPEIATSPGTPPPGYAYIYIKDDNVIYLKDSSGTEVPFGSASAITQLTGDISAIGPGVVVGTVNTVGGVTAANIAIAVNAYLAATAANTPNTLVKRDGSGNFSANIITADLVGNASTATLAATAVNFSGSLSGDVTGTQSATVVATVGGSSAANIHSAELAANAATPTNTASTIVKRDASGNFAANLITANLSGNATTSTSFTGSLVGDVTGTQGATVVSFVGTSSAANIHSAELAANAATPTNTASTIVKRDASGNFAANVITATTFSGDLTGNVTGNVSGTSANVTGIVAIVNGGTNSNTPLNNNRIMRSSGGAIVEAAAITANKALASNASGIPVASTTSDVELGYVTGVTSSIQAQINAVTGSSITALTGDVSATGPGSVAATVNSVGGSSAANIHTAELAANAATSANTPSTIVKRDPSGNIFITQVNGVVPEAHASRHNPGGADALATAAPVTQIPDQVNAAGSAASYSKSDHIHNIPAAVPVQVGTSNAKGAAASFALSDHVHDHGIQSSGTLHAVVTHTVNGFMSAADKIILDAATAVNTPSTLVLRDSSGNFAAGTITASLNGNANTATTATTATNFSGSLSGDVTGTQSATVIATGAVTDAKASLANKPAVTVVATTNQTLSGTPTIDGQATAAGSLILLTAQTTGADNGPWVAAAGAWSRPTWYPTGGTTQSFQFITTFIRLGTTYQGSVWRMTTAGAITIGTTATTWVVTPVSGNFKAAYTLGPQSGSSEVDLNFANANVATLAWSPTSTFKLLLPPSVPLAGQYLGASDGIGTLQWTNPLVNIDGGSPSSNYTASQLINGGTP